jgi:hypothetical protein
MRAPEEHAASLALPNGGSATVCRGIGWYRPHDRLHYGGQIIMAARRLSDSARGSSNTTMYAKHITHGYAVTVHSARGVTADSTHAVLSETATRALC